MRRLFALILVVSLWFSFAPIAQADVAGLTPCSESPAFLQRAENARNEAAAKRFEFYASSNLLCGEEGLPHLIVDGDLSHMGEFLIPGLMFILFAGWIGWAGRSYLQAIKKEKSPETKEIIIDVPLAVQCMLLGATWPLAAFQQMASGSMFAKDDEIPVSPR